MNKLTERERLERQIRLLEGDLKDSNDPKVVKKYPHLGSKSHIKHIEDKIAALKAQLPEAGK